MPQQAQKPVMRWSTFSGEQKFGLVLFSLTGIVGLVLSVIFLLKGVRDPFQIDYDGETYLSSTERELKDIEAQKKEDTDGDGISNYEETNVYRTIAYLADSDGDGFSDGEEIRTGHDPNCPTNQDCGRGLDAGVNSVVRATDLSDEVPFDQAGIGEITSEADLKAYLNAFTTQEIRTALIESGVSQEALSGMSDEDLRALFEQALSELDTGGDLSSIVNQ